MRLGSCWSRLTACSTTGTDNKRLLASDRAADRYLDRSGSLGHSAHVSVDPEDPVSGPLSRLVDEWCERRDLSALARILPAYTSNFGLTDSWAALLEALRTLQADRTLPEGEQREVERLVVDTERIVYRT